MKMLCVTENETLRTQPECNESATDGGQELGVKLYFAQKLHECPRCFGRTVHRAPIDSLLELAMVLIWMWPYRCAGCFLRYFDQARLDATHRRRSLMSWFWDEAE
jgi:hypothetical protein